MYFPLNCGLAINMWEFTIINPNMISNKSKKYGILKMTCGGAKSVALSTLTQSQEIGSYIVYQF